MTKGGGCGGVRPTRHLRARLVDIRPPRPFVVVSESWPSALISLLSLHLPVAGAYFPTKFHRHFNISTKDLSHLWHPTPAFAYHNINYDSSFYIISGTSAFLSKIWVVLGQLRVQASSILLLDVDRTKSNWRRAFHRGLKLFTSWGLQTCEFSDEVCGGATDGKFLFGFGSDLESSSTPRPLPDVPRALRHYLEGGLEFPRGRFSILPQSQVPPIDDPPRSPIFLDANLRAEGLLPLHRPSTPILCPSYFVPGAMVVRPLALSEALRVFQLPTTMDASLADSGDVGSRWPFTQTANSVIFTSIFRQLWGDLGGVKNDSANDSGLDGPSSEEVPTIDKTIATTSSDSTSLNRDDTSDRSDGGWIFELDDILKPSFDMPTRLSDDSTLTTMASEVTLQTAHHNVDLDGLSLVRGDRAGVTPSPNLEATSSPSRLTGSFGIQIDAQLDSLRRVREAKEFAKAVKADDAEVPVYLWNRRIRGDQAEEVRDRAFAGFRRFGWMLFMRTLRRDCANYMEESHGVDWMTQPRKRGTKLTPLGRDQLAISNMLWHATHCSWFEYHMGSRLVHLRFPIRYRKLARDGVPVFFETPGPETKEPQPPLFDPDVRAGVRKKLQKVLDRRYLLRTDIKIKSLIRYFAVPKGENDIRMVYDATANLLNSCVWVPSFWLPTVESLTRALDGHSWMADRDIGDMFLNFQLHASVMPYTGVDLGPMYEKSEKCGEGRWALWDRCLMGFAGSPYNAVKMSLIAEEVVKGDRHETGLAIDGQEINPFQWKSIRLNLPGTLGYDPTMSWVSKLREDGRIACDLFTFVDDERITGPCEELTWQAGHILAAKQSYLGIQDAARKVRLCSKTPGAWAGAVVHIIKELGVCLLTSEDKWAKLKLMLTKWKSRLDAGEEKLAHRELLSDRGFLVYVTRTYPSMVPYLKGFHLTIEMWRGGRDLEGWKLRFDDATSVTSNQSLSSLDITRAGCHGKDLSRDATYNPLEAEDVDESAMDHRLDCKMTKGSIYAPADGLTQAVPRLKQDIDALLSLCSSDLPPLRVIRPTTVVSVFYGFGDASGKQFGATVAGSYDCSGRLSDTKENEKGLNYRVGIWSVEEETESSNYKELCNLVETTEEEARAGRLRNCEFFLCTDNSTAESCFYRGNSSSPKLHSLVLRLRKLEMEYGMTIHVIHVSGKRMIAQGTDGCSRGFLMEGVMAGENMLDFLDLGASAIERHPPLLDWIRSWTEKSDLEPLTPEGWFEEGHGITGGGPDRHGVWMPSHGPSNQLFLWAPPPAVADAALEELLKARHKRTDTYHVIAIPRLMAPRWRRLFNKVCDFTVVVSPDVSFWPQTMFEPLWVGVVLPFTHHRPWQFKRAPKLVEMGRDLREMLPAREADARDLLRKLLRLPRRVAGLSERLACGVLHVPWSGDLPSGGNNGQSGQPMAQCRGAEEEDKSGSDRSSRGASVSV